MCVELSKGVEVGEWRFDKDDVKRKCVKRPKPTKIVVKIRGRVAFCLEKNWEAEISNLKRYLKGDREKIWIESSFLKPTFLKSF